MKHRSLCSLCALLLCGALLTPALAAEPAETVETDGPELTWEELDERILAGSLNVRILDENIGSIEAIDYEMMEDQLRRQLNQIADAQWFMIQTGNSASASSLDETYSSLREVFDDIRDGDLQKDYADAVRQIEDGIHQVLAAGESLYINVVSLEASLEDGNRGLAALDRSLEELRLRRDLGQVSDQQVAALEQTRADTVSQLRTLETTIATYKSQLQVLIGEEPTGELTLGPLPEEAALEWTEPDYEADLAAAKEASWTLYNASLTLEDAEETWKDARRDYYGSYYRYQYDMAEHTWNAAQTTYESAVQDFETSFRTLYDSLADYEQVWENKQAALDYQQTVLNTTRTQYERGMVSHSALLTAEDDLAAAQSEAESAWRDLFNARNNYRLAVDYGILA